MDIPASMKEELGAWNNGDGIDLGSWIGCMGNFSLAVGYASVFSPRFVEFEGYLFGFEKITDSILGAIRRWEQQTGNRPKAIEKMMNHLHIIDLQHRDCDDLTSDKAILIGNELTDIYRAMLQYRHPDKPCIVEFYHPDDPDDLAGYQLTFWQKKHD